MYDNDNNRKEKKKEIGGWKKIEAFGGYKHARKEKRVDDIREIVRVWANECWLAGSGRLYGVKEITATVETGSQPFIACTYILLSSFNVLLGPFIADKRDQLASFQRTSTTPGGPKPAENCPSPTLKAKQKE